LVVGREKAPDVSQVRDEAEALTDAFEIEVCDVADVIAGQA
jgi:hypothetical protein